MLGVCFLSINKFDQSIQSFNKVLSQNPTYKKNIFLLISICYKKKNQLDEAIRYIS
jgi:lipopolysaccharide biosynthesis regulator YciM